MKPPRFRAVGATSALKEEIIARALAAGFDDVGFAAARLLDDDLRRLEEWLADDRHGEMEWLARDPRRRAEPTSWVKSVIVFARAYAPLEWNQVERRYAAYAEGGDYHRDLKSRLDSIAQFIRDRGGRAKRFVDTSAILERAWAREAGIGFIGRNTMLISRTHGPNMYLAEIFTDMELEPDESGTGTCGRCTRCLDICPTSALDEKGLDARKCISYLTIELKRTMTEEEKAMTGPWDFGCDDCVTICPYTRRGLPPIRPGGRGVTRR
ncbi:MAG: tRNA epoxyqueuosine(34) reductase QueG [Candidatus Hydrogenedentota bacterium]